MRAPTRKLRVLFVDDDESVRKTWRYCFGASFDATVVGSAEEALELLEKSNGVPFDVLVADHRMPSMTGAELCWRAAKIAPNTARIIVTAFRDREARVCPARAVLDKPCPEDKMISVIRKAANGERPSEEDVRKRERDAEEALKDARNDFRKTTRELQTWNPPALEVKE